MGIEPTSKAWEAFILPLNYTRGEPSFYGCCSVLATRLTTFMRQRLDARAVQCGGISQHGQLGVKNTMP